MGTNGKQPKLELTKMQLAKAIGVSGKTIEYWIANDLPHEKRGNRAYFDVVAVAAWLAKRNARRGKDERRVLADTRWAESRARLLELEAEKRNGELVSVEQMRQLVRDIVDVIENHVRAATQRLGDEAIEIFDELSKELERKWSERDR